MQNGALYFKYDINRKVYIIMYKILCKDGRAKRAEFQTVHGTVQTPLFMNVGTAAAIKGAVATTDLISSPCETR